MILLIVLAGILGDQSNDSPVLATERYRHRYDILEGKRRCSVCIEIISALCDRENDIAQNLVNEMLKLASSMQSCIEHIQTLENEWAEQERAGTILRHQDQLEGWIFTLRSVTASRAQKYRALQRVRDWLKGKNSHNGRGSRAHASPAQKKKVAIRNAQDFLSKGGLGSVLALAVHVKHEGSSQHRSHTAKGMPSAGNKTDDFWPEVRLVAVKLVAELIVATSDFSRIDRSQAKRVVQALSRYVRDAGSPSPRRMGKLIGKGRRATALASSSSSEVSSTEEEDNDDDDDEDQEKRRQDSEKQLHRRFRRQLRAKASVVAALAHISTVYHSHATGTDNANDSKHSSVSTKIRRLGRYFFSGGSHISASSNQQCPVRNCSQHPLVGFFSGGLTLLIEMCHDSRPPKHLDLEEAVAYADDLDGSTTASSSSSDDDATHHKEENGTPPKSKSQSATTTTTKTTTTPLVSEANLDLAEALQPRRSKTNPMLGDNGDEPSQRPSPRQRKPSRSPQPHTFAHQRVAARVLAEVADDEATRISVVNHPHALSTLVQCLSHSDPVVRLGGAQALSSLCAVPRRESARRAAFDAQLAAATAKATAAKVKGKKARAAAAAAVAKAEAARLAAEAEETRSVLDMGSFGWLINKVISANALAPLVHLTLDNVEAARYTCATMRSLCTIEPNRKAVVDAGAISVLVRALTKYCIVPISQSTKHSRHRTELTSMHQGHTGFDTQVTGAIMSPSVSSSPAFLYDVIDEYDLDEVEVSANGAGRVRATPESQREFAPMHGASPLRRYGAGARSNKNVHSIDEPVQLEHGDIAHDIIDVLTQVCRASNPELRVQREVGGRVVAHAVVELGVLDPLEVILISSRDAPYAGGHNHSRRGVPTTPGAGGGVHMTQNHSIPLTTTLELLYLLSKCPENRVEMLSRYRIVRELFVHIKRTTEKQMLVLGEKQRRRGAASTSALHSNTDAEAQLYIAGILANTMKARSAVVLASSAKPEHVSQPHADGATPRTRRPSDTVLIRRLDAQKESELLLNLLWLAQYPARSNTQVLKFTLEALATLAEDCISWRFYRRTLDLPYVDIIGLMGWSHAVAISTYALKSQNPKVVFQATRLLTALALMSQRLQDKIVEHRGLITLSELYQSALSDQTKNADLRKQISDAFLALGFKDGSYDLTMSSSAFMGFGANGGETTAEAPKSVALHHVHASNLEDWFELDRSVRIHRELMRALQNIAVQTWQNCGDAETIADASEVDLGGVDNTRTGHHVGGEAFSPTPHQVNRANLARVRAGAYLDSPPPRHVSERKNGRKHGKSRPTIRSTKSGFRTVLNSVGQEQDHDVLELQFFACAPNLEHHVSTGNLVPPRAQDSRHRSTRRNSTGESHVFSLPPLVLSTDAADDDKELTRSTTATQQAQSPGQGGQGTPSREASGRRRPSVGDSSPPEGHASLRRTVNKTPTNSMPANSAAVASDGPSPSTMTAEEITPSSTTKSTSRIKRPPSISTRHESVDAFMDFAPTPKHVGTGGHTTADPVMRLNLQPLRLDKVADRSEGADEGQGDTVLNHVGRGRRLPRHHSAPVLGHGRSTPPGHIMRHLGKSRQAQRRKMLLRARDATPAAREGCVETGTIPHVYQELLDIFWPSRLRQQLLSASPLSCSFGDMAQAWGVDLHNAVDTEADELNQNSPRMHRLSSTDRSPITGTILFPAHRNYLAFRFEFVIAAVLKKHQAFSSEWCVSFRNSTFHQNFIEQFCQSLHHFPGIQSLTFRICKSKRQEMHSKQFDEALFAMLVPGVLPEWINWLTFDGCFKDRAAPQVLSSGIRAIWRRSLPGGLNGLALRNQRYQLHELKPILKLLVDFGLKQPDAAQKASPVASQFNSSTGSAGSGSATPSSPPTTGGRRPYPMLSMSPMNGLVWLDLSGNALGDNGAATLIKMLAESGNSRLRGLDLSDNKIVHGDRLIGQLCAAHDATSDGRHVASDVPEHLQDDTWTILNSDDDLAGDDSDDRDDHGRLGRSPLGRFKIPCFLHSNKSLIALKLAHNELSPAAVERLFRTLGSHACALRLLDLSHNGIDLDKPSNDVDDGAQHRRPVSPTSRREPTPGSARSRRRRAASKERRGRSRDSSRGLSSAPDSEDDSAAFEDEDDRYTSQERSTDQGAAGGSADMGINQLLEYNESLVFLDLRGNPLSQKCGFMIRYAIAQNSSLCFFHLSGSRLAPEHRRGIDSCVHATRMRTWGHKVPTNPTNGVGENDQHPDVASSPTRHAVEAIKPQSVVWPQVPLGFCPESDPSIAEVHEPNGTMTEDADGDLEVEGIGINILPRDEDVESDEQGGGSGPIRAKRLSFPAVEDNEEAASDKRTRITALTSVEKHSQISAKMANLAAAAKMAANSTLDDVGIDVHGAERQDVASSLPQRLRKRRPANINTAHLEERRPSQSPNAISYQARQSWPSICVLFAAPLAWQDEFGQQFPVDTLDFETERELLRLCLQRAKRAINLRFNFATTPQFIEEVTRGCKVIYLSGHGNPE